MTVQPNLPRISPEFLLRIAYVIGPQSAAQRALNRIEVLRRRGIEAEAYQGPDYIVVHPDDGRAG